MSTIFRPWLFVVAAFVILVSAWFTIIKLSHRVPTKYLTPDEERVVLQGGKLP